MFNYKKKIIYTLPFLMGVTSLTGCFEYKDGENPEHHNKEQQDNKEQQGDKITGSVIQKIEKSKEFLLKNGITAVIGQISSIEGDNITINGLTINASQAVVSSSAITEETQKNNDFSGKNELLSKLFPGMYICIQINNDADAATILYDEELVGTVSANEKGKINVSGIDVVASAKINLSKFNVGDRVELSGNYINNSTMYTSYITKTKNNIDEVTGYVEDVHKNSFVLKKIKVYSSDAKNIKNGDWVQVEGHISSNKETDTYSIKEPKINKSNSLYHNYQDSDTIAISGFITNIDVLNNGSKLIKLDGHISVEFKYEGDSDTKDDFNVGDFVNVIGKASPLFSNKILSSLIEKDISPHLEIDKNSKFHIVGEGSFFAKNNCFNINNLEFISDGNTFSEDIVPETDYKKAVFELEGYKEGNLYFVTKAGIYNNGSKLAINEDIKLSGIVTTKKDKTYLLGYNVADSSLNDYINKEINAVCFFDAKGTIRECIDSALEKQKNE